MATQAENKAIAESLLVTGVEVIEKLRAASDARKKLMERAKDIEPWDVSGATLHNQAYAELTQRMDERGKQAMGIWTQAQVYATLATIADPRREPRAESPELDDKALTPLQWMHRQAQSNFPNARVKVRQIFSQEDTEVYEIRVEEVKENGKITRYVFTPDHHAADPYKLGPSETWRKFH